MKSKLWLAGVVTVFAVGAAHADLESIDGTIHATDTGSTVDWITFSIYADSIVTFDLLAYEFNGDDYIDIKAVSKTKGIGLLF